MIECSLWLKGYKLSIQNFIKNWIIKKLRKALIKFISSYENEITWAHENVEMKGFYLLQSLQIWNFIIKMNRMYCGDKYILNNGKKISIQ